MRERSLLQLFLILNVALAGAFGIYLLISNNRSPKIVSSPKTGAIKPAVPTNTLADLVKNAEIKGKPATQAVASATNTNAVQTSNGVVAAIATMSGKKFSWQDVEAADYPAYIQSLRAVGCPEDKVRYIILEDINELFAQKRLKEAVTYDPQWWKSEPEVMLVNVLQERGRVLDEERRSLITKLLGESALTEEESEAVFWKSVQLTGPVLGKLDPQRHKEVQEICARSMERQTTAFWARANEGQPLNQVELAKLREQTRTDLRKLLNPEELEEFLLRYSHNAHRLRDDFRGMEISPEEFRKIFRTIDPIDHQVQMEYGGPEALSEKQRERYERQREEAFRTTLSPERYQAWLKTKDPLYRQAQMYALQYGAPPKAIVPIYEMTKVIQGKRQQIMSDGNLNQQQKMEALNAVNQEQMRSIQQIVVEANNAKPKNN